VSRGLRRDVVNGAGRAGGVRGAVGVGRGVVVGAGVSVGWRAARAVWYACVERALTSRVGAGEAEGAQEANRTVSRLKVRRRRGMGQ